jgi:hypothetical protein
MNYETLMICNRKHKSNGLHSGKKVVGVACITLRCILLIVNWLRVVKVYGDYSHSTIDKEPRNFIVYEECPDIIDDTIDCRFVMANVSLLVEEKVLIECKQTSSKHPLNPYYNY